MTEELREAVSRLLAWLATNDARAKAYGEWHREQAGSPLDADVRLLLSALSPSTDEEELGRMCSRLGITVLRGMYSDRTTYFSVTLGQSGWSHSGLSEAIVGLLKFHFHVFEVKKYSGVVYGQEMWVAKGGDKTGQGTTELAALFDLAFTLPPEA